jgi:hypothetical protein
MSLPPPPPPGLSETPPPPGDEIPPPSALDPANIPPPAPESEQHEVDVLKRRKHFSWKKFGGEGFLISVAFHVLLLIAGLFWIVTKWREPAKKVDETFASGAGGGANGDKAKAFEHKMQRRQPMIVKSPSRIVSKSANASVSLPSTPTTSTASFASGLSGGGMSKGSGGGSGGGEGPGIGIGKGGGKNFVSAFGRSGMNNNLLTGSIYDFYQTKDGRKSKYPQRGTGPAVNNLDWLTPLVTTYIENGWNDDRLAPYFKGPAVLGVPQILIPVCPDTAAPDAFEATGKMTGGAWIVVYRGKVTAPETAEIRFVGNADNYLAVAMNGKNILNYHCGRKFSEEVNIGVRRPLARGEWFKVQKGSTYDMAILIGDAGGVFSASLCYEKKDQPKKLILFRTEISDFSDFLQKGRGEIPQNIDPDSPAWPCKAVTRSIR